MNLLFLDSIESDVYGGMEEWIRLVASGLVQRGHRVRVIGRPGSRFLERLERETHNVQLEPLDISGDFHPGTIARLKKIIRDDSVDAVVVNFNKDVRLGGLAARLDGGPRVIWSVGLDITRDSWIHRVLTPRLIDGVIVPSESLKSQITRHGYISSEIVKVIPIGIPDIARRQVPSIGQRAELISRFNLPQNAFVVITVGRLVEQKGHTHLIEAMPRLVKSISEIKLLWCGNGPLESSLKEQARQLGVLDHIVFAGMLDSVEPVLTPDCLMAHPSIEEPFGIAILEGMRAGMPIVASNVGGIPEVLGDAGILIPHADPNAIAHAIEELHRSPVKRANLAISARKRFEDHFSLEAMVSGVESYLAEIIQTEKRHG